MAADRCQIFTDVRGIYTADEIVGKSIKRDDIEKKVFDKHQDSYHQDCKMKW